MATKFQMSARQMLMPAAFGQIAGLIDYLRDFAQYRLPPDYFLQPLFFTNQLMRLLIAMMPAGRRLLINSALAINITSR
jgi:hypothetical protein